VFGHPPWTKNVWRGYKAKNLFASIKGFSAEEHRPLLRKFLVTPPHLFSLIFQINLNHYMIFIYIVIQEPHAFVSFRWRTMHLFYFHCRIEKIGVTHTPGHCKSLLSFCCDTMSSIRKEIHFHVHRRDRTEENEFSFAWMTSYHNRTTKVSSSNPLSERVTSIFLTPIYIYKLRMKTNDK